MPFLRTRVSKGFRVSDLRGVGEAWALGARVSDPTTKGPRATA